MPRWILVHLQPGFDVCATIKDDKIPIRVCFSTPSGDVQRARIGCAEADPYRIIL